MGKVKNIFISNKTLNSFYETVKLLEEEQIKLAQKRIWVTKEEKEIPYSELEDSHLEAILNLFEQGKFGNRAAHYKPLREEQLRRQSKAGEILFGN